MNDTFIFGSAVKVSPVVYEKTGDQTKFRTYFPKGKWVSLADYSKIVDSAGGFIELDMNQQTVNAHLRPGSIIPIQQVDEKTTRTTADLITKPTSILINRDAERLVSEGTVFLDGGESLSELTGSKYEYYQIQHKASKSIQFQLKLGTRGSQDSRHFLESIVIPNAEDLRETDFACVFENDGSI
jgi:alpha-glucosidase (family GH31 glycosyl hydrolase)